MSSETFELVAQDDVVFFVHKDILAHQSQPFKEATRGEWKESVERKISLQDWDAETVGRLVQFLYTGDYQYVDRSLPDTEQSPTTEATDVVGRESGFESPDGPVLHPPTLAPLQECIEGAMPKHAHPRMTYGAWLESVDTSTFDFGQILLGHARVYVLAHFKAIAGLKTLAQGRLSGILLKLHPLGQHRNPHLAMNVVNLAIYVYGNTDSLSNSVEPLRNIISHFVALNLAVLQSDTAAAALMCNGDAFIGDLLAKVCSRLGDQIGERIDSPGTRFISAIRVGSPKLYLLGWLVNHCI